MRNRYFAIVVSFSIIAVLIFGLFSPIKVLAVDLSNYGPLLFNWSGRQEYGAFGCEYTLENFAMWSYINPNNGYNMFGYYWNGTYNGNNLLSYYPDTGYTVETPFNSSRNYRYGYWYADYSAMGLFESSAFYVFSSESECLQYLAGDLEATEAINYDEISSSNAVYDDRVPSPSSVYISNQTSRQLGVNVSFDSESLYYEGVPVFYDMQVYHYYRYDSIVHTSSYPLGKHSNKSSIDDSRIYADYTLVDSNGDFTISLPTVSGLWNSYQEQKEISTSFFRWSAYDLCLGDDCPIVAEDNTALESYIHSFTVRSYDSYHVDSGISLFKSIQDMTGINCNYTCSQVKVQPYVYIDGNKCYGKPIVVTKYINESTQNSYTFIPQDSSNPTDISRSDDVITDNSVFDDNGNRAYDTSLSESGLLDNIRSGYGLSGSDGYFAITNRYLSSIPSSIWTLIGFALSVSIIICVFKAIRGM